MKLLNSPNRWSCLPTAFAMCLDVEVQDILNWLQHDGSDIIWPELHEPYKRRSFGVSEMIDYCFFNKNRLVHCIDFHPVLAPPPDVTVTPYELYSEEYLSRRGIKYLDAGSGVITGRF